MTGIRARFLDNGNSGRRQAANGKARPWNTGSFTHEVDIPDIVTWMPLVLLGGCP